MNDFTKDELQIQLPLCPKCNSKFSDTAAIFWNKEMSKIIEKREGCSNRLCGYLLVTKYE